MSFYCICRLKDAGIPVRFCTNETQKVKADIVKSLTDLGFDMNISELFPPAPAVCSIIKERALRPHLVVHPGKHNI